MLGVNHLFLRQNRDRSHISSRPESAVGPKAHGPETTAQAMSHLEAQGPVAVDWSCHAHDTFESETKAIGITFCSFQHPKHICHSTSKVSVGKCTTRI